MTRDEALEILEIIADVYTHFELTKRKADILLIGLQKMEFTGVKKNLEKYVSEKVFVPSIAEIASYPKVHNEALEMQKQYVIEARNNPATLEVKLNFRDKMNSLLGMNKNGDDSNDI